MFVLLFFALIPNALREPRSNIPDRCMLRYPASLEGTLRTRRAGGEQEAGGRRAGGGREAGGRRAGDPFPAPPSHPGWNGC